MADLNQDGFVDLVTTNNTNSAGSHAVSVLLGNGDGTFRPPQRFFAGTSPSVVVIADVNENGILDLVVANGGSNDVSSLLGNGDGTFQIAQHFAVDLRNGSWNTPCGIAAADVNADAHIDLISNRTVLLGKGDGSFRPPQVFNTELSTWGCAVSVLDLNSDRHLDLVTTGAIALGNSDGTFQKIQDVPFFVDAIVDINADGALDLVSIADFLSVMLGNGDGTFQTPLHFAKCGSGYSGVAVVDLNGDGKLDLAATSVTYNRSCHHVSVLLQR